MAILVFDTTGAECSVALRVEGQPDIVLSETIGRGHAERLAPMAQDALKQAGIAPPLPRDDGTGDHDYFARPQVACPRCDSLDTTELSAFGATACKAQHRCLSCHEPFDYFKCL